MVDLFAGSGALAIEALSRGARFALFVDNGAEARALLRANVEALGLGGVTRIWRADAARLGAAPAGGPFGLAFLDPPYGQGLAELALAALVQRRLARARRALRRRRGGEGRNRRPCRTRHGRQAHLRRHPDRHPRARRRSLERIASGMGSAMRPAHAFDATRRAVLSLLAGRKQGEDRNSARTLRTNILFFQWITDIFKYAARARITGAYQARLFALIRAVTGVWNGVHELRQWGVRGAAGMRDLHGTGAASGDQITIADRDWRRSRRGSIRLSGGL